MKKTILMSIVLVFVLSGLGMAKETHFAKARDAKAPYVKARYAGERTGLQTLRWWKIPRVAQRLSLTKEETEKLDSMYFDYQMQMIDLRCQLKKDRLEMEQVFEKEPFDAKACLDSFKKSQAARNGIGLERFNFLIKVREVLGSDRFQTLKQEFRHFREQREFGRWDRGPRGRGPRK